MYGNSVSRKSVGILYDSIGIGRTASTSSLLLSRQTTSKLLLPEWTSFLCIETSEDLHPARELTDPAPP